MVNYEILVSFKGVTQKLCVEDEKITFGDVKTLINNMFENLSDEYILFTHTNNELRGNDLDLFLNTDSTLKDDITNYGMIKLKILLLSSNYYDITIEEVIKNIDSLDMYLTLMKDDTKDDLYKLTIPHFNVFSRTELKSHYTDFQKDMLDLFPTSHYEHKQKHPIDVEMETMAGISEIEAKHQKLEKQRLLYDLQQRIFDEKSSIQQSRHKEMYDFFSKPYSTPMDISEFGFLLDDMFDSNSENDDEWIPRLEELDIISKKREKERKRREKLERNLKKFQPM